MRVVVLLLLVLVLSPSALAALQPARVVGYASWENLTGCYAPGRCRTACGPLLDDSALTVAANPALGLGCGARIVLCRTPGGRRCQPAVVMDRTASVFTFELTYRLSRLTGAPRAGWDGPRTLWWRRR